MGSVELGGVRHLYIHVPFCKHRCGYCDFVTVVGHHDQHGEYVESVLRELKLRHDLLAPRIETVYIGGGTPTYLTGDSLVRLLKGLPDCAELTIEANPETVTPDLARLLRESGVNRVSLGAQSFQPILLEVLERFSTPKMVSSAVNYLRSEGIKNISLDLIYGIPGQSSEQLLSDVLSVINLAPEHISTYELEAKRGTRFTYKYGDQLDIQAEELEEYMELITVTLQDNGYQWYETASFSQKNRSQHNLGYWLGHDYLGIGVGAVSTVGMRRWQNSAGMSRYLKALCLGDLPPLSEERLTPALRLWEKAMLGLRLDEGVRETPLAEVIDYEGFQRMIDKGLIRREDGCIRLTSKGRFLGDAVTSEILVDSVNLLDSEEDDSPVILKASQ